MRARHSVGSAFALKHLCLWIPQETDGSATADDENSGDDENEKDATPTLTGLSALAPLSQPSGDKEPDDADDEPELPRAEDDDDEEVGDKDR